MEVLSSSLDRVLIHPRQPHGVLSLKLIISGVGAQPGLWESLQRGDEHGIPKDTTMKPNGSF